MYSRILVPVDGSEVCNAALKEAIKLAKEQHSTLRLVHVVDRTAIYSAVDAPYLGEYLNGLEAAGKKVIADCSATVAEAAIKYETATIVLDVPGQHVYDAIEQEAKRWRADLIVIGTHGRRGFRRFLLGSVAEGVIRVATTPVLLIRGA